MTNSTKQALVEHVARAIADEDIRLFRERFPDIPIDEIAELAQECKDWNYMPMSLSAIRATLEWARDNPTDEMISRGQEQIEDRIDKPVYPEDPTIIEITPATRECFRAMLSALLQELDKGDG